MSLEFVLRAPSFAQTLLSKPRTPFAYLRSTYIVHCNVKPDTSRLNFQVQVATATILCVTSTKATGDQVSWRPLFVSFQPTRCTGYLGPAPSGGGDGAGPMHWRSLLFFLRRRLC